MRDEDFGTIRIKLEEVIQQSSLSKNKVAQLSQTQRGQLNHYCKGDIQRIDLAILSRLCYALDCRVEDVLEYIPPQTKNSIKNGRTCWGMPGSIHSRFL